MTESTKTDYKNTLNLPQTTLAMRANATVKELETQKFWAENHIYEKMLSNRDKTNSFVLHDERFLCSVRSRLRRSRIAD